ncbi:MAG TPA: methyltransferase domain-containing protein [Candidatus Methanofastidiosa archaeon]|nr:methyltransferase domain-containing protein [Candidatus Methanofastidiosa archaeon]
MKNIDGNAYLELSDVVESLKDSFDLNDISSFIGSGDLKGIMIDDTWMIMKKDLEYFIDKYVRSNIFYLGYRHLNLKNVNPKGRILDVGGGGEGVIGQLAGDRVIAIDKLRSELEEASECDCVKLVMDATEMGFTDRVFDTATAFFSFMYMDRDSVSKVLRESCRVLKDGGELHIWDMRIPKRDRDDKGVYAILLKIDIGGKVIETGYGTRWNKVQDIDQISAMALESGFEEVDRKDEGDTFYLKMRKCV